MEGPETGEELAVVVGGDDNAAVELCEIVEQHHAHPGLHVPLPQFREHRIIVAFQHLLVYEEDVGEVVVPEVGAEGVAHGDGAVDFLLLVGLDGDGASDERNAAVYAHRTEKDGAEGTVDAAGDAEDEGFEVAAPHVVAHHLPDVGGDGVEGLFVSSKGEKVG